MIEIGILIPAQSPNQPFNVSKDELFNQTQYLHLSFGLILKIGKYCHFLRPLNLFYTTEQKLRMHARKVVTLSHPSSLEQIPKLDNTPYFLSRALNYWFIISRSLSVQKLPYLRLVNDVILYSVCSVSLK